MMVNKKLVNHLLLFTFVFEGVYARGESTIVINEGDELLLNCTLPVKFNIIFPRNNSESLISTSEHELVPNVTSGQIGQWTFRRKKSVFGDTGQYIFAHVANRTIQDYQHIKTYQYFYVYVRSMKNLFVQRRYSNLIMASFNSSIIIPCRPTAPELQVLLINSKTNENANLSESVRYDPKIGFIMTLTNLSGSSYLCRANRGLLSAQLSFSIIMLTGSSYAKRASVSADKTDHLVIGQTLKLNCTVVLSSNTAKDHVIWMIPRNSAIIRKNKRIKHKHGNDLVTYELTVKNLTFNDMGLYTCNADISLLKKEESVFINVYNDIEIKSSKKPHELVESIKLKLECISWYGSAFRTIEWLNKNNETILNDERIEIFHSEEVGKTIDESFLIKRTYLHINNISKADEGVYTCLVKNFDNSSKSISYEVTRILKALAPYFKDTNMKGDQVVLYTPAYNVSKMLYCIIKGIPRPRITWYKNDLPLNMSNTESKDLIYIRSSPDLLQLLFTNAESSGIYKCIGTNSFGRVEAFTEFIVLEKDLPFFWNFTQIWFILILTMLAAFLTVKVRYDTTRKRVLDEIGLLPFPQGDVQTLHLVLADQQLEIPYNPEEWEFKRKYLTFGNQLSSSGFGVLLKAEAQNIIEGEKTSTVVVKKVLQKTDHIHREAAGKEFKIHTYIGSHINIVRILAICTDKLIKGELLIIMEYCKHGNLLNYMLRNKSEFVDQIDPATGKIDPAITVPLRLRVTRNPDEIEEYSNAESIGATYSQPGWRTSYSVHTENKKSGKLFTQDLNNWAYQISCAMEYLHHKKIIHSDLAARNVLLTDQKVIKICDIGIAKTVSSDYTYRKEYSQTFPIKWMAIESIKTNNFSLQSDLWSYAVTLWEIYSFAEEPYPGILHHQIYDKLVSGYRMGKPRYALTEIYDIMLACWNKNPCLRPPFSEIAEKLKDHADEVSKKFSLSEASSSPSISSNHRNVPEDDEAETEV